MSHTKEGIFFFLVFFILAVSVFGGHFGWTTNGVPAGGDNILLDTFGFFSAMVFFNIDGLPAVFNIVFSLVNILTLFVGLLILRGD
jgi:hypothetical protein